ncbi:NAD(P)-dependent alcohol dehydrogenase [Streptomyces venezuelae]|uniref:NAD(P)-dependent alcohol dehydrogenase n=1 Tax=Streptomyces venezuelae TaxID=54571 RepID=A0A5P2DC93_STRVZ|nr:NAD(P)-dependent alcohol dehydrogenase [Streptomyces venezuelae]QES51728.1 NAD(P)-dependent alcohol dehydrogenase [Streptomyces venezuelae]
MKAIVQDVYGSADVLRLAEVDRPAPRDDEVLVRVHAAGVDAGVWHLMTGLPRLLRPAYGLRRPRHRTPGMDLAGRVEAVGRNVTRFRPGDEVFGIGRGTFAEYACAPERKLAPKPAGLTFEQAAAVPASALTALQALRDRGQVRPGAKVLVIGAAGGVGTYAVQLARALGAEVTGVCSTGKTALVRSIGADHVVDYTREDITDGTRRYDLILDIAGNRRLSRLRRALTPTGTLVLVGGDGGPWLGGTDRLLRAPLLSAVVRQRLRVLVSAERHQDLLVLTGLIESGRVTPVVDRTYPLEETPEAIRRLADRRALGKVVVTVVSSRAST